MHDGHSRFNQPKIDFSSDNLALMPWMEVRISFDASYSQINYCRKWASFVKLFVSHTFEVGSMEDNFLIFIKGALTEDNFLFLIDAM